MFIRLKHLKHLSPSIPYKNTGWRRYTCRGEGGGGISHFCTQWGAIQGETRQWCILSGHVGEGGSCVWRRRSTGSHTQTDCDNTDNIPNAFKFMHIIVFLCIHMSLGCNACCLSKVSKDIQTRRYFYLNIHDSRMMNSNDYSSPTTRRFTFMVLIKMSQWLLQMSKKLNGDITISPTLYLVLYI